MKKKVTKKNSPAMKSDLVRLENRLSKVQQDGVIVKKDVSILKEDMIEVKAVLDVAVEDIHGLRQDVDILKTDMKGVKKVLGTVLEIVQTIDVRLRESDNHGPILHNHEKRISDTEIQLRMMRRG